MSASLHQFLHHVLPPTGCYILASKSPSHNWMQQVVVDTIDNLAEAVLRLSQGGCDTYFACSAYTGQAVVEIKDGKEQRRYRLKEQTAGTMCFWLDIDVSKDKADAYDTLEEAERDLFNWIDEYSLPEPTIVYSGGGLHVYWALTRVLPRAEWEAIAYRLKVFCERTELRVDTHRTADIASILRPPGTLNFKRRQDGERVLIDDLAPAIDPDDLAVHLPQATLAPRPEPRAQPPADKFTYIGEIPDVPALSEKIAQGCQWIRAIGPHARGNVAEPLWYAMLGVLAFAADGDRFAHAWSNGHPGYDPEETDRKLEQVRARQTGPISCSKLEYEWRDGCAGCPLRGAITTPLQLGRPKTEKADPRAALTEIVKPSTPPVAGAVDENAHGVVVDFPYFWLADGSLQQTIYNDDNPFADRLYAYPWYIESMRKAELSGTAHALIRHWAPHDGWQEANIPAGDLTAEGSFRMLGNQHIEIDPPHYKPFLLFMSKAKQTYRDNRRTELQHETFGWKDEGFLIGETLVVGPITARAGLSPELKRFSAKLSAKGDLSLWQAAAQHLFLPGYEHQGMAILASLGAPLMRFAPYPGTVYSIVSEHSGRGKTYAVEAATSVWGDERCVWISHRDDKAAAGDTVKAQYRAMVLLKNLPVVADELRETDAERLRGFITGFTDGSPPRGLTREGIFRHSSGLWQTILLTTSNKSITDIVTINNDPAAANRVFEVQATLPKDADANLSTRIRKAMLANCGLAGIAYIQKLMEPETFAWAQSEVAHLVDSFTAKLQQQRTDSNGGDRFIASFLACCIVAGKIATAMGLLKINIDRMLDWAFARWGMQRTQIEQSHRTSTEAVSAFVREHIQNIVVTAKNTDLDGNFRGPLVGRLDLETRRLFIDRNVFQRWTTKENLHYLGICEELSQQGVLLERNARRNLGKGTKAGSTGQTAVWIIDSGHPALSGELREVSQPPTEKPSSADAIPLRTPVPTGKPTAKEGGANA